MRGKKIDKDFVTSFIIDCAAKNKTTDAEIISEAKLKISEIDNQIKQVEDLKKIRSKLLDVVISLGKNDKKNLDKEIKVLSLYDINHIQIAKYICDLIKNHEKINIKNIYKNDFNQTEFAWCIKQLLTHKVIYRLHDFLFKGQQFDLYMKSIMSE